MEWEEFNANNIQRIQIYIGVDGRNFETVV